MRRDKTCLALLLLVFLGGCASIQSPSSGQSDRVPASDVGWSQPVNGIRGRFSFEKGDVVAGTRIVRVFLELQNVSDNSSPVCIRYDPWLVRAGLFDAAGKPVPRLGLVVSTPGMPTVDLYLPVRSTMKLDLTGYDICVTGPGLKACIGLHGDLSVWGIRRGDAGAFWLGGTFSSELPATATRSKPGSQRWEGTVDIPKARVNVLDSD